VWCFGFSFCVLNLNSYILTLLLQISHFGILMLLGWCVWTKMVLDAKRYARLFKFWTVLLMGSCVFTLKWGDELFERISPQVPPPVPNGSAHTTTRLTVSTNAIYLNYAWWVSLVMHSWGCSSALNRFAATSFWLPAEPQCRHYGYLCESLNNTLVPSA